MANTAEHEIFDGVAVIGMAGRFPGAASVDELWENLKAGRESIRTFTDEELAAAGLPEELIRDPSFVKARGLLDAPELFDAEFFGISPHEAELMDPQHRLFLETCWHALENAGHAPASIDVPVGVWGGTSTGMSNDTYLHHNLGGPKGVREEDVLPSLLGNANDYLTTRVSYKLDLRGPSVNVQTACSTSLMAIVQAFQSLMTYGCDMALAGGVSVSYPQANGYLHQEGGIGSPDGHCRPFDASAQGTVFSNGVGVVVLRRLEDAIKNGDTILAVIRGAASNNDGAAKISFAAPSATGQAEVIASALTVAGVDPSTVTYVETHGTGTALGDPIELEGLTRAFRLGTEENGFCALGSIKSNFGHLDSAAGVAGFIKAVLCLRHRTLVPTVHFTTPNPLIDWNSTPFFVNSETRSWAADRGPLRAGVSAFGIGGTNAHVILEEAPLPPPLDPELGPQLLAFSARSRAALQDVTQGLARDFAERPDLRLADVAHTLQSGRESFRHRATVVANSLADAREILSANDRARMVVGESEDGVDALVFLLPGGGAQHVGMGRDLYESIPSFRDDVDQGLELLREREGLDLRPVWFSSKDDTAAEDAFHRPSVQLPAIFILEMAMARLLMRWGFQPTALIGHSLGENTAACLAGVLSYPDALGLVALRGRLFDTAAPGGMLSVSASPERLREFLGPELDLATVNGPEQCSVSGPRDALDALAVALDGAGIDAQPVPIDIAAHSSLVEPLLEPFEAYLRSVELRPPTIPFLSNYTGTWITDAEATDPHYWALHLRGTVRFADNVGAALDRGRPFFLEVGPGRFLSSLVKLCKPTVASQVAATMRHPKDGMSDHEALLGAVGRAWVAGREIAWDRIRGDTSVRRIPLPGYPFQRKRFLVEPRLEAASNHRVARSEARTSGAHGNGTAPLESSSSDVLGRILDLQARTTAAIAALFTGEGAPEVKPQVTPTGDDPKATGEAVVASSAASDPSVSSASEHSVENSTTVSPLLDPASVVLQRADVTTQLKFWSDHLGEVPPVLDLMTDEPRSSRRLRGRTSVGTEIPGPTLTAIDQFARDAGVAPFDVVLAAYAAVLHLETGQDDFVIGTSALVQSVKSANSDAPAFNTLPLRAPVDAGSSFRALVERVEAIRRLADANRDAPLALVRQQLGLPDDATRSPVFQCTLDWKDRAVESKALDSMDPGTDLDLIFESGSDGVRARVEYPVDLFRPESMRDLLSHLLELLRVGLADPDSVIRELPAAAPGVVERVAAWNDTATPLPSRLGLADWLTEAWPSAANRTAVVAGATRLTYAELNERSNRLANHLVHSGARPGTLVGLCLNRTAELLVALVAVWKAGAGYVPLDPNYPIARLGLMAKRAELDLLVTVEALQDRVEGYQGKRIFLDVHASAIAEQPAEAPVVDADLSNPAYVLFTSGSTGEPKGVQVPSRSVLNLLQSMSRRPGFHRSDVLLAVTTLSFDISVLELFLPLRVGGTVVVASDADTMDGSALARLISDLDVTVLQATPSTWRLLLASGWDGRPRLRALCGGEAFPRDLLKPLLSRVAEVWNMYGPTETTVWSVCARLTDPDGPMVIGSPIDNTSCYVLDEAGRPVAPGLPGELYIGGAGVADGYLGRPDETAQRFLHDPFATGDRRMYRTGDVVRWRRDGMLEHLHRSDQQVKLRGFRIELGEVEAALAASSGVRAAAVRLMDVDGTPELVGYVAANVAGWSERSMRGQLVERLPFYMVPRILVRLDEIPLTDNGKIDRKALPDPMGADAVPVADQLEPPTTEAEVYLFGLWQEVLGMTELSVHDNFFDLGGHSLLAVRTIARIREERGVDVPLRSLLAGTLRTIAGEYFVDGASAPAPRDLNDRGGGVLRAVREWISR